MTTPNTPAHQNQTSLAARRAKYQAEIASITDTYLRAAHWLPFDALALRDAFTEEELAEAERLIDALADAASREKRQLQIVEHFAASGAVVLKLLKLAGIAP
ncbi:MAG: hypothetical protein ACF8MJ_04400 [Phycisphaerales bacterium JB050]